MKFNKFKKPTLFLAIICIVIATFAFLYTLFFINDRGVVGIDTFTNLFGYSGFAVKYRDCSGYAIEDIYAEDPRYDISLGKYCVRIMFADAYGSSEKYRAAFSDDGIVEVNSSFQNYKIKRGHYLDDVECQAIYVFSDKPFVVNSGECFEKISLPFGKLMFRLKPLKLSE